MKKLLLLIVVFSFADAQNYSLYFDGTGIGLSQDFEITLNVYDIEGRKVATLVQGVKPAGVHSVGLNASKLPSGVYFVKLNAGEFTQTQKLMLVK